VNEDALSSVCFSRMCSSSWGLVAPRHRWPLAPWEQMGIGHVKSAEGSGDGVPVATQGCVGGVWWRGGHPTRRLAAGDAMAGAGESTAPMALVGEGRRGLAPPFEKNNDNVPINVAHDFEPHAQAWHLCKLALVALLGGKGSGSISCLLFLCMCCGLHKPTHAFGVTTKHKFVVGMAQRVGKPDPRLYRGC
jgi:hypothetical protein